MADGVLPRDGRAVCEAGGDVVSEVTDDGGEDSSTRFIDAADESEKINSGFE